MVNFVKVIFIGHICGFDPGYENYKYMYLWDIYDVAGDVLTIFDSAICVK